MCIVLECKKYLYAPKIVKYYFTAPGTLLPSAGVLWYVMTFHPQKMKKGIERACCYN